MTNDKKNIRRAVGSAINALSGSARSEKSRLICAALAAWPAWADLELIVSYHPMSIEPDILPLLCRPGAATCLVRTPECDGGLLEARVWNGREDTLVPHPRLPLLQVPPSLPEQDLSPWAVPPAGTWTGAALVPGVAFTAGGTRLGRGKGWYDRFLGQWPGLLRIGVCFREQLVDRLPEESWDVRMDMIACDGELVVCGGRLSP
jgi:5,10-methenyltetrahydrofolate synthetase